MSSLSSSLGLKTRSRTSKYELPTLRSVFDIPASYVGQSCVQYLREPQYRYAYACRHMECKAIIDAAK